MFDVLLVLLLVGGLVLAAIGIGKAFSQIAAHVQSHPDAGKALFDHLFLPLFGGGKGQDSTSPPAAGGVSEMPPEEPAVNVTVSRPGKAAR